MPKPCPLLMRKEQRSGRHRGTSGPLGGFSVFPAPYQGNPTARANTRWKATPNPSDQEVRQFLAVHVSIIEPGLYAARNIAPNQSNLRRPVEVYADGRNRSSKRPRKNIAEGGHAFSEVGGGVGSALTISPPRITNPVAGGPSFRPAACDNFAPSSLLRTGPFRKQFRLDPLPDHMRSPVCF